MTAHPIDIDHASSAAAKRAELDALEAELAELTTRRDVLARETEAYERFAAEIAAIRGEKAAPTKRALKAAPKAATKAAAKQPAAAPKASAPKPGAGERIIDRAVAALRKAGKPMHVRAIAEKIERPESSVAATLFKHARAGDLVRLTEIANTFEALRDGAPTPKPRPEAPTPEPRIGMAGHLVHTLARGDFQCGKCKRTRASIASFEFVPCDGSVEAV